MKLSLKVDPLAAPFQSKKKAGFFMRKCLVPDGAGGREVMTIGSDNLDLLTNLKSGSEITVNISADFCFAA